MGAWDDAGIFTLEIARRLVRDSSTRSTSKRVERRVVARLTMEQRGGTPQDLQAFVASGVRVRPRIGDTRCMRERRSPVLRHGPAGIRPLRGWGAIFPDSRPVGDPLWLGQWSCAERIVRAIAIKTLDALGGIVRLSDCSAGEAEAPP